MKKCMLCDMILAETERNGGCRNMDQKSSRSYMELYGLGSEREVLEAEAKLKIAAWMGLIPKPDLAAVEERRRQKNDSNRRKLESGEIIYGVRYYTPPMYLQYELTRFRLEFTVYKGTSVGPWSCQKVTEVQKKNFYEANRDLFTRYFGDSFAYDEVHMIIEKRLKEMEYEKIVQNILC